MMILWYIAVMVTGSAVFTIMNWSKPSHVDRGLGLIHDILVSLHKKVNKQMQLIDDILSATKAEATQVDSVLAALNGLETKLNDALGNSLSADDQAKLTEIFQNVKDNAGRLTNAINEGTPAAAVVPAAPVDGVNGGTPQNAAAAPVNEPGAS